MTYEQALQAKIGDEVVVIMHNEVCKRRICAIEYRSSFVYFGFPAKRFAIRFEFMQYPTMPHPDYEWRNYLNVYLSSEEARK